MSCGWRRIGYSSVEGRKRPSYSYLECARHHETFEKWIANEQATSYSELNELMVMEQFINVAEKEFMPLLREKRLKNLKEAVMCWRIGMCHGGLIVSLAGLVIVCLKAQLAPLCSGDHVLAVALEITRYNFL